MDLGKKIRIALIDDNILFRKSLKSLLSSFEGFFVQADADNAPGLVDKLKSAKVLPDICIISSEALMLNNNQTLKELKSTFVNLKVLSLASYYNEFAVYKMLYDRADGYVLKNCNPTELKKALLIIHNTGKYWEQDVLDNWPNTHRGDYTITKSQISFLSLCVTNLTYTEIAQKMGLSPRTIDGFRELLFKKFNVDNRTTLALFAVKNGIIKID